MVRGWPAGTEKSSQERVAHTGRKGSESGVMRARELEEEETVIRVAH